VFISGDDRGGGDKISGYNQPSYLKNKEQGEKCMTLLRKLYIL